MNSKLARLASLVVLSQANMEGAEGSTTLKMNYDLSPLMPTQADLNTHEAALTAWKPSNDPNHDFTADGKEFANIFLAAEQGIVIADQNMKNTQLEGLRRIAVIPTEPGRIQYLTAFDVAFRSVGTGGKLKKGHQNYMSLLRRTMYDASVNGWEVTVKKLSEPGDFAQRTERLDRQSAAGGHNKGGGEKGAQAAAAEAIKEHGAEAVKEAVSNLSKPPEGKGISRKALEVGIKYATDADLIALGVALGNRFKECKDESFQLTGAQILDLMDELSIEHATDKATEHHAPTQETTIQPTGTEG